jgi:DNA polymerase I-like protein with 3'-5' exonuclease and polymerase domains
MPFAVWDRIVFIDTEKTGDKPWSVQFGQADWANIWVVGTVFPDDPRLKGPLFDFCAREGTLTVIHNALFDIPVLRSLGIFPSLYADTMQMAYLLGMDSIGLKPLAYRLCNIPLREFDEVTAEATQHKAREYLERVVGQEWDDPLPYFDYDTKGEQKVHWPQNIRKKVIALLKKYDADPTIDLHEKWYAMEVEKGRGQVEEKFGKMDRGWLCDVPREEAEEYALGDVKATAAIFPILWPQIQSLGLEETFWRDMGAMEMVMDMEANGCRLDIAHFHKLGEDIRVEVGKLEGELERLAGYRINVNSHIQVGQLMQRLKIPAEGTGAEVLDRYRHIPEVKLVQEIRGLLKLLGTYIDKFPGMVDGDGRIHTRMVMTRTETGRIASKSPNLMNIPVRTEWGKKIRRGFVACGR